MPLIVEDFLLHLSKRQSSLLCYFYPFGAKQYLSDIYLSFYNQSSSAKQSSLQYRLSRPHISPWHQTKTANDPPTTISCSEMATTKAPPTVPTSGTYLLLPTTIHLFHNLLNPLHAGQLSKILLQAMKLKSLDAQPSNPSFDPGNTALITPTPVELRMGLHQWRDGRMKASRSSLGMAYRAYTFEMRKIRI